MHKLDLALDMEDLDHAHEGMDHESLPLLLPLLMLLLVLVHLGMLKQQDQHKKLMNQHSLLSDHSLLLGIGMLNQLLLDLILDKLLLVVLLDLLLFYIRQRMLYPCFCSLWLWVSIWNLLTRSCSYELLLLVPIPMLIPLPMP